MDLVSYIGKRVHIVLLDGFFYIGKVLDANNESISILDKKNSKVYLSKQVIGSIREVS